MTPFGYSDAVWRLFIETPRAGRWERSEALTAEAGTPASPYRLRLQVKMDASRVCDARFQAYGCPTTIAVGAWLAERAVGRRLDELPVRALEIREALEIPEDRLHCALLGEDVINALLNSPAAAGTKR